MTEKINERFKASIKYMFINMGTKITTIISTLALLIIFGLSVEIRAQDPSVTGHDDGTMLLFVGENIDLLSIASRREETPAKAPAVAEIISREVFLSHGNSMLSQILEETPGFYMARKEWGHKPYLRGLADSVLFLYDTVPLGSELSKSLHPIDHELSLASIKQVEIVRGPSSVLWGPDAFAGVVNVVPLSGKDFQGVETGILYQAPGDHKGAYFNLGHDAGKWDAFFSISARQGIEDDRRANLVSFFDYDGSRPVPPDKRLGSKGVGDARYLDAYARFNMGKKASLSGRFSDSYQPYTVDTQDNNLRWKESRSIPFGYLKLDANHDLGLETKIRFSGYYSQMNPEHEIIDMELTQKEKTFYSEFLVDRSMFRGMGLLTAGLSYKYKEIKDAPIWDSYIPGYLTPDNVSFLPTFSTKDFDNQVWSFFTQYNQKLGDFDLMLGLRQDFHREYRDNLSYSAALVWSPISDWTFKLLYGTSYRTPFARQLLEEDKPDMEKLKNYSFQATWNPEPHISFGSTFFYNRISSHIMEDPYAGLSQSNKQDIYGVEVEAFYSPLKNLFFEANLTLLENNGSDESYRYKEYSYILPDGTVVDVFTDLRHPFDTGPKSLFDLMATWKVNHRLSTFAHLEFFSSRKLIYARGEYFESTPDTWLLHAGTNLKDFPFPGLDLSLKLRNIADNRYKTPGTYNLIKDNGISGEVILRYSF